MKQPKRPTREQKEFMSNRKLNVEHWAVMEENGTQLKVINKTTGTIRILDK